MAQTLIIFVAVQVLRASGRRFSVGEVGKDLHADKVSEGEFRSKSHFTVSDTHVEQVCTNTIVRDACKSLGAYGGRATPAQLAETLAVEEGDAVSLLEQLGLDEVTKRTGYFGCQAFCFAAVSKIPSILEEAVPASGGLGCVDDACAQMVDVSEEALTEEGLGSSPRQTVSDDLTIAGDTADTGSVVEDDPELKGRLLFRLAVNAILGVFPAPDETDDDETLGASLIEKPGVSVTFGNRTRATRHSYYREYVVKASAWIAYALKRMRGGRSLVRKWFNLQSEAEVDAQMIEARKHLMRMWQLMNNVIIKKGIPAEEGGPCKLTFNNFVSSGIVAYVMTYRYCDVQRGLTRDCGTKENGRYIVNMCEYYWYPRDKSSRIGTIVHEASHHFGTKDNGYCSMVDCLSLPSEKARTNADSYAELVKELVQTDGLEEDLTGGEYPSCNTLCDPILYEDWDLSASLPTGTCGKCEVKTQKTAVLGLSLWGEECGADEVQVAKSSLNHVCCKPLQCTKPSTTTTSTTTIRKTWWW